MTKPLSPQEVIHLKKSQIPGVVFEVFNDLIKDALDGKLRAVVAQDQVVDRLVQEHGLSRDQIFADRWLDVEESFREAGWIVTYHKPAYYESFRAYFEFRVPSKEDQRQS